MRLNIDIDLTRLDPTRQGEQLAFILHDLANDLEDGEALDHEKPSVLTFAGRQVGIVAVVEPEEEEVPNPDRDRESRAEADEPEYQPEPPEFYEDGPQDDFNFNQDAGGRGL